MRRGFTLLEAIIAGAILSLLVLGVYALLKSSSDSYANQSAHSRVDGLARDLVDRIAYELRDAGVSTLFPSDPDQSAVLNFQRNVGFAGGQVQYGPMIRFEWQLDPDEADNGQDDDGDGLADEGRIVRTESGDAVAIQADGVKENGLRFTRPANSDRIVIVLELQHRDATGTLVERSATTSVHIRN